MRRHRDGSYWLPKQAPLLEKALDETMDRIKGTFCWFPKNIGPKLEDFKGKFKGTATIIGKGPSLDGLQPSSVEGQACFCINDSIKKFHELNVLSNVVQQDGSLRDTCIPQTGMHFLSHYARGWNRKAIIYKPEEIGYMPNSPTVLAAIKICIFMGFTEFNLFAFDALKTNKITEYAKIIGYSSSAKRKRPERFFQQAELVKEALQDYKWRYV